MFAIDTSDLQRIAISSVGALILSTACVIAAVSPVKAATPVVSANAPLTIGDWQGQVEQQIDRMLRSNARAMGGRELAVAVVKVRFDGQGDFAGATIGRSTGTVALDREALRTAAAIRYPALPSGLRGRPQTVAMQLFFGRAYTPADNARLTAKANAYAIAARNGVLAQNDTRIASLPSD